MAPFKQKCEFLVSSHSSILYTMRGRLHTFAENVVTGRNAYVAHGEDR